MKTAARENPNRWAKVSSDRAHSAAGQNRSCSFKWVAKQENSSHRDVFSLDFPFYRTLLMLTEAIGPLVRVNVPGFIVGRFSGDPHWPVLGDP
jgi:hypothetical protein